MAISFVIFFFIHVVQEERTIKIKFSFETLHMIVFALEILYIPTKKNVV